MFDKKYKIIIKFKRTPEYMDMLDWVDKNSNGSVDIKREFSLDELGNKRLEVNQTIFVGFEKEDDATFFRIKYAL